MSSYFTTKSTQISPARYGKHEQQVSQPTNLTLQVFLTSAIERITASLSNSGNISFHIQRLVMLSNSKTGNRASMSRPLIISTPLDPRQYETKRGIIQYNNSSTHMSKVAFDRESPYNSAIITGQIGDQLIPHFTKNAENPELVWDNDEHNKHARLLAYRLSQLSDAKKFNEEQLKAEQQKLWDSYMAVEKSLEEKGILIPNLMVVVNNEGFVPVVSTNQNLKSGNEYLDAKHLFGNENSTATYCPLVNIVDSVVELTDAVSDKDSSWTYGIEMLGDSDIQSNSKEAYPHDHLNRRTTQPLRVVIQDSVANKNSDNSRSERFEDFAENNNTMMISQGELVLGFTNHKGLSTRFSITGDNLIYRAFNNSSSTTDIIGTGKLDLDDMSGIEDMSFDDLELADTAVSDTEDSMPVTDDMDF